jgi:peptidoglycan/xylan/chitin deacetylase (PgdA/CDA1 family)
MVELNSPGHPTRGAVPQRPWSFKRQPSALTLSAIWHAAALGGLVMEPSAWAWWLGGTLIDHAVVTAAGLWPRSSLLGPNWTRLPAPARERGAIALTIDDGPDPQVTPRVLDLLERHDMRATFFCIGERAQRYASITREIVARGHAVENHTHRHRHTFSVSGPKTLIREVAAGQAAIADITGEPPRFFRAPAGLRNLFLESVLQKFDLKLAAWTRRGFDTKEGDPRVVSARLLRGLAAADVLLLHDGDAATSADGSPVILSVIPELAAAAREQQLKFVTLREAAAMQ